MQQNQTINRMHDKVGVTGEWLSAHIFFNGELYGKDCDRVILDLVAPFVQVCHEHQWITRYFFIRYGENGPHVRLRLYGRRDILECKAKPLFSAKIAAPLRVLWIPYEPEMERYGGSDGVTLAELFFHYSSDISIFLLGKIISEERSSRLGKALLSMSVLLYVFLEDRTKAAKFARNYGMNYLKTLLRDEALQSRWVEAFGAGYTRQAEILAIYINETWERLQASETLSEVLDRYRRNVHEIKWRFKTLWADRRLMIGSVVLENWEHCVSAIVSSYMHMMNNRLGVTLQEESYLAYLLAQTLGKSVDN
jgi:thiopeptide-type bacteriocin biosynthesis protein